MNPLPLVARLAHPLVNFALDVLLGPVDHQCCHTPSTQPSTCAYCGAPTRRQS